jgi:HK97 family phage prohead protease
MNKRAQNVRIKDATKGEVEVVFATFNVVDHDGDVTLPGAFTDGEAVRISAYGHKSWEGALPVGKGVIRQTDTEAIFEGSFFLETTTGRDTFTVVKEMGDLQEWSYGFDIEDSEPGVMDGRKVQIIKKVKTHEVSPVLLGAGINTRTLAVKGKQLNSEIHRELRSVGADRFADEAAYVYVDDFDPDEGWAVYYIEAKDGGDTRLVRVDFSRDDAGAITLGDAVVEVERVTRFAPKAARFSAHVSAVLADVKALIDRTSEVMALRASKGKALSADSTDLLGSLEVEMKRLNQLLVAPTETDTDARDALMREHLRFIQTSAIGA